MSRQGKGKMKAIDGNKDKVRLVVESADMLASGTIVGTLEFLIIGYLFGVRDARLAPLALNIRTVIGLISATNLETR